MNLVGINLPSSPDPDFIRKKLERFQSNGFDCVEITLDIVPLIVGGEIADRWAQYLKALLAEYPFRYSAHIGRDVDLRDTHNPALQKKVLFSSIRLCAELSCNPLVLHFEKGSPDPAVEELFLQGHREAADLAADLGVVLCMENIEVDALEPVADFVARMDHPNLRMTFDTGHAWLASRRFEFDFFESLDQALPVIGHVHLSDNVGIFEELRLTDRFRYDYLPMGNRLAFGRGDVHVPPFWGAIPFREVFRALEDYPGMYICEYQSERFLPFNGEIRAAVSAAIREAQ